MSKIVRVGVTFPPDLLRDFDEAVREAGYENRSKAVQDAVRLFVSEKRMLKSEKGARAGVLVLLYDHEAKGLENELTHLQHCFSRLIRSTVHVHLNRTDCLETIAVRGNGTDIRRLSNELSSKKGVKVLKTTTVSV